jgi:hypothetical protein
MTVDLTEERARRLLPYLVQAAENRRTITYKELAAKIGVYHRTLSRPLGYIRDKICAARGLPLITCIVVNLQTRLPGAEWLPLGASSLSDDEDRATFEQHRDRVFAYGDWQGLLTDLNLKPV